MSLKSHTRDSICQTLKEQKLSNLSVEGRLVLKNPSWAVDIHMARWNRKNFFSFENCCKQQYPALWLVIGLRIHSEEPSIKIFLLNNHVFAISFCNGYVMSLANTMSQLVSGVMWMLFILGNCFFEYLIWPQKNSKIAIIQHCPVFSCFVRELSAVQE